jgi:hypothetical protein
MSQVAINIPGSTARLLFLTTAEGPSALPNYRRCCRIIATAAEISAPVDTQNALNQGPYSLNKMLNIRHFGPYGYWLAAIHAGTLP